MIVGIGSDLVEIDRIARALQRYGDRFVGRVLVADERRRFVAEGCEPSFLAKRFAAKEAMFKAIGSGLGAGVGWQQVEVCGVRNRRPGLAVTGRLAELCAQKGISRMHLALSDERAYALAFVVLEAD